MCTENIVRPKTRGELVDLLKQGITCEVVASNEEITSNLIKGWLHFNRFTTRPSYNKGWVLYVPLKNSNQITDEEILKIDFYDFCGVGALWMTDKDKIEYYRRNFH